MVYSMHKYICNTLRGQIRDFQGNISYIALPRGQYLDIAWEGGFQLVFDQTFDLPFDLWAKHNEIFYSLFGRPCNFC